MVMNASSPFGVNAIVHVAGAAAFTGGAAACFLIAGASAQASAETESEVDSNTSGEPAANRGPIKEKSPKSETETKPGKGDKESDLSKSGSTVANPDKQSNIDSQDGDDSAPSPDGVGQVTEDIDENADVDAKAGDVEVDAQVRKAGSARSAVAPQDEDVEQQDVEQDLEQDTDDVETQTQTQTADGATDDEEPTLFSALARATAEDDAEAPSLFDWVQRTFFNRTPTVSDTPGKIVVKADGSVTGKVVAADADGDVLTYQATPLPRGGTVTISGDGSFVYKPAAGTTNDGGELFSVAVSDDAPENGWHVHGLLGLLVPGWGSTATTNVDVGPITRPAPPTPAPTTPAGTATAAARYGWGTPRETRFTGPAALAGWGVYNSPGHNGYGRRTPKAISFVDGAMVITGDAAGNTGGLAWSGGQQYGAWEVRMKVPKGAADYHAVALLWPDAENWPVGGEIDFVEILGDASRQNVSHVLHYSAQNRTEHVVSKVDATAWHNYAVSWTPQAITVYIDSLPKWTTTNTSRFPPGRMHLALQLDASEKRPINLSGGAQMAVAWARQYSLSQIS